MRDRDIGSNRSEHTGLELEGLVEGLGALAEELREADVVVVGIARNSTELASDEPCETAVSAGFGCVDIYAAFNGPNGLKPAGDLLSWDYTHPSQKGNDLITSVLTGMGFAPLA